MANWERYTFFQTVTAVGDHQNQVQEVNADLPDQRNADLVAVDGILTVLTNTDNLVGLRLLILDDTIATANITEDNPGPHESSVWYNFFAGRGPMVFRMRSKKTLPPNHNLWIQVWKASGTDATAVHVGFQILWVRKFT